MNVGTTYIICSKKSKSYKSKYHFEGDFVGCEADQYTFNNVIGYSSRKSALFHHYVDLYRNVGQSNLTALFDKNYNFYDANKVKNAKKARQSMEKRSLDMVLKRLVNEEFEW